MPKCKECANEKVFNVLEKVWYEHKYENGELYSWVDIESVGVIEAMCVLCGSENIEGEL